MDKKLQDILEELVDKVLCDGCKRIKHDKIYIAQAKKEIEEMFGEWVGEDERRTFGADKLNEKILTESDVLEDYRKFGYNQAKQEIRNRVKEGVK